MNNFSVTELASFGNSLKAQFEAVTNGMNEMSGHYDSMSNYVKSEDTNLGNCVEQLARVVGQLAMSVAEKGQLIFDGINQYVKETIANEEASLAFATAKQHSLTALMERINKTMVNPNYGNGIGDAKSMPGPASAVDLNDMNLSIL